jgi:hypothetical protein
MKNVFLAIGTLALILTLATCSAGVLLPAVNDETPAETPLTLLEAAPVSAAATAAPVTEILATLSEVHAEVATTPENEAATATIVLNGDAITADGAGVAVEGSVATITAAGIYAISGVLTDGQIVVDSADAGAVQLLLNGVDLRSSSSAPINIRNAEEIVIVLAANTMNAVTDGATYLFTDAEQDEPNAAIFSKSNLTITGDGALTVQGNYNDGIASKDGLIIAGGVITVNAIDDGIRGKDYLVVKAGELTVNAGGDGLKSDNEEDAAKGYILVESGIIRVTSGGDALTAQSDVLVAGGEFILVTGGGRAAGVDDTTSAKGIKAVAAVQIDGGAFTIDAADDALHSNGTLVLNGGSLALASGDDGIHADAALTINDGDVRITYSYEGIESAVITLNGGAVYVTASDDGVNVAGGVDGSGMNQGPRPGGGPGRAPGGQSQETFTYTGSEYLYIHGGYLVVDAAGDGLDANGAIEMTGGVVLVNGPTENMNGALDYDATFNMTGGYLVTAGSAGMAQAPGANSSQNALLISGTLVHIQDSAGNDILTFAPAKQYQTIAFSSPALVSGESYTIYSGGSASGALNDGLYQEAGYTPGAEYTSFTIDSPVTIIGNPGR